MELHHSNGFSIRYRHVPLANGGDGVNQSEVGLWILAMIIGVGGLYGCGLDGVTGTLVQVDGEWYRIQTPKGGELRVHVDTRSRKDAVVLGDRVHAYVSKSGHAEFLQRLE
jgi:hypothetical protein